MVKHTQTIRQQMEYFMCKLFHGRAVKKKIFSIFSFWYALYFAKLCNYELNVCNLVSIEKKNVKNKMHSIYYNFLLKIIG